MLFQILALFFGLALLHTSMAIKCIAQPDYEELKKFEKQFPKGQKHDPLKQKREYLRVLNTSGEVDCDEIARQKGLAKPTHCAWMDDLYNCTKFVVAAALFKGVNPEELQGIKAKECHFEEPTASIESSNIKKRAPENICHSLEHTFGCPRCQVCNKSDYCNSGTEMGATEVTEKPEEKNGAGLPNGGAPQVLFLLLLAIATGAFRWAAFL